MKDYQEVTDALRCSSTVGSKCKDNCKYRLLEEVKPDIPVQPDVWVNGVGYWASCDCDRIATDAAAAIEEIMKYAQKCERECKLAEKLVAQLKRERDKAKKNDPCAHCLSSLAECAHCGKR